MTVATVVSASWNDPVSDGEGLLRLDAAAQPGGPPLSVWYREGEAPRAIILVGHGGSQHRRAETVVAFAQSVLDEVPAYVAAIDGPAHGDRLVGEASNTVAAFVECWNTSDGGVPGMVADWRAALARVSALPGGAGLPIGYYGVSMGTAYGLPFLATEPGISAAALGQWDAASAHADRLLNAAPAVKARIHFVHRVQDSLFSEPEARRLFAAIGGEQKTFQTLPGPHGETRDQLGSAARFLVSSLVS